MLIIVKWFRGVGVPCNWCVSLDIVLILDFIFGLSETELTCILFLSPDRCLGKMVGDQQELSVLQTVLPSIISS